MFDVAHLIEIGGLAIIAFMIFAECGMMVGFLFPGDTLLLGAGIVAATGKLPLIPTIAVVAVAAIAGDICGYIIGRYFGKRLFRAAGRLAHKRLHLARAQRFFRKYGSKTMLVAHFIPYVRSFAPVAAGASKMSAKLFVFFDAIGDITWAISLTLLGFFVGSRIPDLDRYLEPLLILATVIFLFPNVYRIIWKLAFFKALRAKFW